MENTPFRPPAVDDLADRVEGWVGVRPEINQLGPREWEVRLAGEHLVATGGFRMRQMDGRTKFLPGKLFLDGQERRPADDLRQLRDLWNRYENGEYHEVPELEQWTGELDEVPKAVRKFYLSLTELEEQSRGTDRDFVTRLGLEDGTWYVGCDTTPEAPQHRQGCIRIAYVQHPDMPDHVWMPEPTLSLFIVDGMRSRVKTVAELNRLLMELVNATRARPASSSSGPISHGRTATPGKANSVAVRRATVVRV